MRMTTAVASSGWAPVRRIWAARSPGGVSQAILAQAEALAVPMPSLSSSRVSPGSRWTRLTDSRPWVTPSPGGGPEEPTSTPRRRRISQLGCAPHLYSHTRPVSGCSSARSTVTAPPRPVRASWLFTLPRAAPGDSPERSIWVIRPAASRLSAAASLPVPMPSHSST